MKKFFFIFLTIIVLLVPITAALGICFDPLCYDGAIQQYSGLSEISPVNFTARIINWALSFLGIISLILIIYAGFLWMWARGEEEKVTKAKDILKGAIIGLIIILGSYGLAFFVFDNLINMTNGA